MRNVAAIAFALLAAAALAAAPSRGQEIHVLAYLNEPFFFTGADGKPAGLEYEILEFYARGAGRKLRISTSTDFPELLAKIGRGEADVASGTITITPERRERLDFSGSYFPVRLVLVERAGGPATTRLDQLAGATLATIEATTMKKRLAAVPNAKFTYARSQEELLELVASGAARATAVDSALAYPLLPRYPALRMGMALSDPQELGFAVPKGSALAGELSRHIARLKESGIYFRLVEKYLGAEAVKAVAAGRQRP
jgi:ABC-type amino acid transport substrate-binding protein